MAAAQWLRGSRLTVRLSWRAALRIPVLVPPPPQKRSATSNGGRASCRAGLTGAQLIIAEVMGWKRRPGRVELAADRCRNSPVLRFPRIPPAGTAGKHEGE